MAEKHAGLSPIAIQNIANDLATVDHLQDDSNNPILKAIKKADEISQTFQQSKENKEAAETARQEAEEAKKRAEEAEKNSITDSLTGLYNRRYLNDYTENFDKARTKKPVAVVFCDADNLGAINKQQGDAVGDQLLINISNILKDSVRPEDRVVRKGGDEFIVIIEGFSNFEELKEELSRRFNSRQTENTQFSFGIVQYDSSQDKSFRDTIQRGNDSMKENNPNKKIPKH